MNVTPQGSGIQGIVLAGVHAWGESALEQVCPRPLLPVVGQPLIWYVLNWLGKAGIDGVSICANSDTSVFRRCLDKALPEMHLDYYADLMPRGPAGCVRDAARPDAQNLLVVEASVATRLDVSGLLEAHQRAGAALTVVVSDSPTAPAEPVGVYLLSREALAQIPTRGYQDIKEMLIPRLHKAGQAVTAYYVSEKENLRVRDAASYLAASSWALETAPPAWTSPGGYRLVGTAWVHETARVAATARLVGSVVIGPGCWIEEGATIVGCSTLGAGCRIGPDAVVSRSAVWTGCEVEAGAIVDHCVLVAGAVVEPAGVMRDTVCLPSDAASQLLDPRQDYWALPSRPRSGAILQEMLEAGGRVEPLAGVRERQRQGSGVRG